MSFENCTFVAPKIAGYMSINTPRREFDIYTCQFVSRGLVFGDDGLPLPYKVLAKVMDEDYQGMNRIRLMDKKTKRQYYHETAKDPINNTYFVRVANERTLVVPDEHCGTKTEIEHPYLYVFVLAGLERPLVMIEKCRVCPQAGSEVARVLGQSISSIMAKSGRIMTLKKCETNDTHAQCLTAMGYMMDDPVKDINTLEELHGYEVTGTLLKKKRGPKRLNFRNCINNKTYADTIIRLLHEYIDGKTKPKDIMRPIRAALEVGAIRKVTLKEFESEFGDIMNDSSTMFDNYQNLTLDYFKDDKMFEKMRDVFAIYSPKG